MMNLGLALPFTQAFPLPQYLGLVAQAEAAGYDTLWTGEVAGADGVTTMAVLATHTKRVNAASGILPIQTRTPIVLGMTAVSLGHMAPGRIRLGLGVSSRIIVNQWNGLPFERPLEQLREAVQIIRTVLAGERVNFEGKFYRIKNFRLMQPPPDSYGRFFAECGFAKEVEAVSAAWKTGDRDGAVKQISERFLDGLGVVGPADFCRRRLAEFAKAGLTQPVVFPFSPDPDPVPTVIRTLQAVAP